MIDLEKDSSHKYMVTSENKPHDVSGSCAQSGSRVKVVFHVAVTVFVLAFVVAYLSYKYTDDIKGSSELISSSTLEPDNVSSSTTPGGAEQTTFLVNNPTTVRTDTDFDSWPYTYGGNIDGKASHPAGFRDGQASDTHSCDHVRAVPEELRSIKAFYSTGIPEFYQKYTEAYGIPVLGSINVTDEGLKRACYILRLMLASRYDIRNTMYKFYIRVVLIGDDETLTSLWEYRDWNSDYWDQRARALGASMRYPLVAAGDDNQRCRTGTRYQGNDILVHEFSHGVHEYGARYVIPGFELRLNTLYENAMAASKYKNTYAATNRNEYWAVATEIYFASYTGGGYTYTINGSKVALRDQATLALYDPGLVDLLREVFPCTNIHYSRCAFKVCDMTSFRLLENEGVGPLSADCELLQTHNDTGEASLCAEHACSDGANIFLYKPTNTCVTYNCHNVTNLGSHDVAGDLYIATVKPGIGEIESSLNLQQLCTRPINQTGRCDVAVANRQFCGPFNQTSGACEARGCCYLDGQCVYAKTSACMDRQIKCQRWAVDGDCDTRPEYMTSQCPNSCHTGVCNTEGE